MHITSSSAAVAAAYGWPTNISEDEALTKLLELNGQRPAVPKPAGANGPNGGEET
jgi:hypothetical protein